MATGGAAGALRRFELDGVHDTGREVGHGSYAVVRELEYHGLKCVGKKIHGILFESATPYEKAAMLERFAGECELLGGLCHPCIVQFLGVWYEQGSRLPVLVMEYLHTTLSACLVRYGVLPDEISYGILRDVALGLRYLHERSPPIVHRDLSANNVLLTSNMNAKLSDLGVAKILNLTPARMTQMTQTIAPGTPCYMPPEALTAKPKYTTKIDIYSYGVLIIHTLCGRWPFPGEVFQPDPQNPDAIIPASEVERRAEYLHEIGNDHPLMAVICQCLSNASARRPEAPVLLDRINTILSALPQKFTNRVEMLQQFEARIQTLTAANQSKQLEIDTNRSEIESLRAEVERLSVQSPSQQARTQPSTTRESNIQNQPSDKMVAAAVNVTVPTVVDEAASQQLGKFAKVTKVALAELRAASVKAAEECGSLEINSATDTRRALSQDMTGAKKEVREGQLFSLSGEPMESCAEVSGATSTTVGSSMAHLPTAANQVNQLNPDKSMQEQGTKETATLGKKLFFSDQKVDRDDPIQLNLLYVQSHKTIIDGTHPCTREDAVYLAALQCQVQYGHHNEAKHKGGFLNLVEFLPREYVHISGIEKVILAEYRKLYNLSEQNAKYCYIQLCRSLHTNSVTFLVKEKIRGRSKLVPRLLGITQESIMRMDVNTKKVLNTWPLTTIRRWAASPNSFTLDFGDYSESYYSVQTTEGETISQLIGSYIDILMLTKTATLSLLGTDSV